MTEIKAKGLKHHKENRQKTLITYTNNDDQAMNYCCHPIFGITFIDEGNLLYYFSKRPIILLPVQHGMKLIPF